MHTYTHTAATRVQRRRPWIGRHAARAGWLCPPRRSLFARYLLNKNKDWLKVQCHAGRSRGLPSHSTERRAADGDVAEFGRE